MPDKKLDLGLIQKLLDDPAVSEIMVNGSQKIFVERNGKKVITDVHFTSEEEVYKLVERVYASAGKRLALDVPYADVCLEDGTRINAIIPPLARFGIAVTFRKFSKEINSLDDLVKTNTVSQIGRGRVGKECRL